MERASNRQETAVRLSRSIRITRPAALLAVVIGLFLPAAVASAAPTHPPDSAEAARAAGRSHASFGGAARTDPAEAARAVGRYYASFGDERPIAPSAVTASAPAETDGPTWAAALIAGVVAAVAAAGLGVVAGRRTVRFRHG
jgi:hypothetical protein